MLSEPFDRDPIAAEDWSDKADAPSDRKALLRAASIASVRLLEENVERSRRPKILHASRSTPLACISGAPLACSSYFLVPTTLPRQSNTECTQLITEFSALAVRLERSLTCFFE